jgi:hypothetical protein
MGQINVNYDDRTLQGIDRLAATKGMSRPELLRAIAGEAIEAHDGGRLAFQVDDTPRIDGSMKAQPRTAGARAPPDHRNPGAC